MAVLQVLLVWTDTSGTSHILNDYASIYVERNEKIQNNNCRVKFKNSIGSTQPYIEDGRLLFEADQPLNLYVRYDTDGTEITQDSQYLLFSGRVIEYDVMVDQDQSFIEVKASDSSYVALNRMFVEDIRGTAPELVKKVIDVSNENAPEDQQITAELVGNGGLISDTMSEASGNNAFPQTRYATGARPAYEALQELSQPYYTGEPFNVNYRFYVTRDGELKWFYPEDNAQHVIVEGASTPQSSSYTHPITGEDVDFTDDNAHRLLSYNMTKSVYDIVNFILFKAGEDIDGNQIRGFAFDPTSGVPITKEAEREYSKVAKALKYQEQAFGNLTKGYSDEYTLDVSTGETSWGVPYGSADEYNDAFRAEAIRLARLLAQLEFRETGNPRWQGKMEIQGERGFEPNDAMMFTARNTGIDNIFLRLTNIQHNIDKNGWFTTLRVREEIFKEV